MQNQTGNSVDSTDINSTSSEEVIETSTSIEDMIEAGGKSKSYDVEDDFQAEDEEIELDSEDEIEEIE